MELDLAMRRLFLIQSTFANRSFNISTTTNDGNFVWARSDSSARSRTIDFNTPGWKNIDVLLGRATLSNYLDVDPYAKVFIQETIEEYFLEKNSMEHESRRES